MRRSATSIGVGVLMIAFPMSIRYVRAEAADGQAKIVPIESAKPNGALLDRIAGPDAGLSHLPLLTVGVPLRHTVSFPRGRFHDPSESTQYPHPAKKKKPRPGGRSGTSGGRPACAAADPAGGLTRRTGRHRSARPSFARGQRGEVGSIYVSPSVATTFLAASVRSVAVMIGRPLSASILRAISTFVPSSRTTSGTLKPTFS